jgi:Ca2+-binding EF-hand superfamily protein
VIFSRASLICNPIAQGISPETVNLSNVLSDKSIKAIVEIWKELKICDTNNNGHIDIISSKLQSYGIKEHMLLGKDYNKNIWSIIATMPQDRHSIVSSVYDSLQIHRMEDFKKKYDPKFHPHVKSGKLKLGEAQAEFIETFDTFHSIILGKVGNSFISKEDFTLYYCIVNFCLKEEKDFVAAASDVWHASKYNIQSTQKVSPQPSPKKSCLKPKDWKSPTIRAISDYENIIIKIRLSLSKKGIRGIIGLAKLLKLADSQFNGQVNDADFRKVLYSYKLPISDTDINIILEGCQRKYMQLLNSIKGKEQEERVEATQEAFDRIENGSGYISKMEISELFYPKYHPYAKLGVQSADEIMEEFLEVFDTFHNIIYGKSNSVKITKEEFMEFHSYLSSSIRDASVYIAIVNNCWNRSKPKCSPLSYSASKIAPYGVSATEEVEPPKAFQIQECKYKHQAGLPSTPSKPDLLPTIISKLRDAFYERKLLEFILFKKTLLNYTFVDSHSVLSLFQLFKILFAIDECQCLLAAYHSNPAQLMSDIIGNMSNKREEKVLKLFGKLYSNSNGAVTVEYLFSNIIIR